MLAPMNRMRVLVLLAAGCGTARYIQKTPTGGTLVLEGDPDSAKSQAQRMMVTHCAGGYTVVSDANRAGNTEAERLRTKELSYVCRSAPPKPSPPKPAAVVQPDAGEPPPAN